MPPAIASPGNALRKIPKANCYSNNTLTRSMGELSIRPSAAHRFGVSRARAAALTARAAALHGAARGCGAARWHCCVVGARRRATGDGRVLENMYRSAPRSGALGRARPGGDGREGDVTRPPPARPACARPCTCTGRRPRYAISRFTFRKYCVYNTFTTMCFWSPDSESRVRVLQSQSCFL